MKGSPGARLRELLARPEILLTPGAYDAMVARLIEQAGFPAVYISGAGVSNSLLGQPDIGLVSMTEMADRAAYICDVVQVPVVADIDNGYGNALNVRRTIRSFERAGVAGVQLEDQVLPKRCGHMSGKQVITTDEMVGKVKAALDARHDQNLVLMARTDAVAVEGLDRAIERGQRYLEAGADVIFIEAPESEAEMRRICREIDAPLVANMVEGGRTPMRTTVELQEIGYRWVVFPGAAMRTITRALTSMLKVLKEHGTTAPYLAKMFSFTELNQLMGLDEWKELEAKYKANA
jgi:methylisocitrate lyase